MPNTPVTLPHHKLRWEVAFVLVAALWGWSYVAVHDALKELSDSAFNAYRFLVAAAVLLLPLLAREKVVSKTDVLQGVGAGLALYLAFLFQTKGLKFTSASNVAFITGLAVIFTPIFLWIGFKTRPQRLQMFGAVLATTGLGLMTLKGLNVEPGDLLALLGAAAFALHIILLGRASKVADIFNITFIQILVVGILSLAQGLVFQEFSVPHGAVAIRAVVIVGILGTALAFYVQTKAQVASSANTIALIIVLEPLFGGLFGYLLAGDRLTVVNWVGAVFIVAGVLVAEVHFAQRVR